jgi:aspartate/glutamate racemase
MATDGTIQSRVFHRELEKQGIEAVVPSSHRQADVMRLIFDDI